MWNLQISNQNNLNNNVHEKDIDQNPDPDLELDPAHDQDLVNRLLIKVVEVLEEEEVGHAGHPLQMGATPCPAIWRKEVLVLNNVNLLPHHEEVEEVVPVAHVIGVGDLRDGVPHRLRRPLRDLAAIRKHQLNSSIRPIKATRWCKKWAGKDQVIGLAWDSEINFTKKLFIHVFLCEIDNLILILFIFQVLAPQRLESLSLFPEVKLETGKVNIVALDIRLRLIHLRPLENQRPVHFIHAWRKEIGAEMKLENQNVVNVVEIRKFVCVFT